MAANPTGNGKSATRFSDRDRIQRGAQALFGGLYEHSGPLPNLSDPGSKSFLSAPLESLSNTGCLPRPTLSFFASLFLLRKVLPSNDPSIPQYLDKLSARPIVSPEFLETIDKTIPRLFKPGWDKEYPEYCRRVTACRNSCLEKSTRGGGGIEGAIEEGMTVDSFFELMMTGRSIPSVRKIILVERDGKKRLVTVASFLQYQLLPLHLLLYAHLSKQKWILKGDAKVDSLKGFTVKGGEIFVSGDYENATDNFNAGHSRHLLNRIFDFSEHIPTGVKRAALDSLTGSLMFRGSNGEMIFSAQLTGQLMGNLLSFPLLCLTNFLGVVHALGWTRANSIPLKINGDDIVFRCRREEFDIWSGAVAAAGLTLSRGKTLLHHIYFSINSTFFHAQSNGVRLVPVLRAATILGTCPSQESLAGRIKAATWGWYGKKRRFIISFMLRYHRKIARQGHVSWTRGFGIRCGEAPLVEADLLKREVTLLLRPAHLDRFVQASEAQTEASLGSLGFVKQREARICKECRSAQAGLLAEASCRLQWQRRVEEVVHKNQKPDRSVVYAPTVTVHRLLTGRTKSQVKFWWWQGAISAGVMKWIWGRGRQKRPDPEIFVDPILLCMQCSRDKELLFVPENRGR